MNQQGENAFPAQKLIAERTGLSERSVRTHLAHARRDGWIQIYRKARPGKQAWFVHEYVAIIPDNLAELCTSRPWEDDPTWQRAENSAGRKATSKPLRSPSDGPSPAAQGSSKAAEHQPLRGFSPTHDDKTWDLPERPANDARRAATDDTTPGKICRDARQGLPTNSSSNSPSNCSQEGAALSRNTALTDLDLKKGMKKPELTGAARLEAAKKLVIATGGIEASRKTYQLSYAEEQTLIAECGREIF
jgi:hypothetical protein